LARRSIALLAAAGLMAASACSKKAPETEAPLPSPPVAAPAATLVPVPAPVRNAPLAVSVGPARYRLAADLWRDFQPSTPPEGRPLQAAVWLRAQNARTAPAPDADSLWVVYGDSAWGTRLTKEAGAESDTIVGRYRAEGGPLWEPGIPVDVVVRLVPSKGTTLLLRVARVPIARAD
jgi:hypothetical protein